MAGEGKKLPTTNGLTEEEGEVTMGMCGYRDRYNLDRKNYFMKKIIRRVNAAPRVSPTAPPPSPGKSLIKRLSRFFSKQINPVQKGQ
jgi:hypothetical protein